MKSFILVVLCVVALSTPAKAQWVRVEAPTGAEIAEARCNIMAMSQDQGYWASGSPGFVLGAALGNAIGNAIRRSEFKRNCMVAQGWHWAGSHRASRMGRVKAGVTKAFASAQPSFRRKRLSLSRACERARTMAEMVLHCGK